MAEIDRSVDLCARARRLPGAQAQSGCLPACRKDQGAWRCRLGMSPAGSAWGWREAGAGRRRGAGAGARSGHGAHAFAAADCGHAARGTGAAALCAATQSSAALACPPMASINAPAAVRGWLPPVRGRIMALPVRLPAQPQRMSLSALPALSPPMTQFLDADLGRDFWTRPLKRSLTSVGASCRPQGLAKGKGGFASGCGKGARPSRRGERLPRLPRSCRAVWGRPALSGAVRA